MGRHSSATEPSKRSGRAAARLRRAAGYTLVESMIASVLLAVSVIGVSGTILSSYAHDQQSIAQGDAVAAAETLMSELTALPFTAGSANDVGLMDFATYSDTSQSNQVTVATADASSKKGKTSKVKKVKKKDGSSGDDANVGLVGDVVGLIGGLLGTSGTSTSNTGTGGSSGTSSSSASTAVTTSSRTASRSASVIREDTLNGVPNATGDLAIVTVDVTIGTGQKVRMRRLVSSAEAASTVAGN